MKVEEKVIVITGAARGIGQEYARYFGSLGARVVIADINDCAQTLELVRAEKGTAVCAKLDVASATSAMDTARTALDAFGRDNIRVNAVAPSAVLTEGTREFFAQKTDKALDAIRTGQAIARNLTPSDLLGAVHWLISDSSQLVTGQTIAVDGGTVMH